MNKKDSLALLNECLNQIKSATADDISRYEAAYKKNCSSYLYADSFDFCTPQDFSSNEEQMFSTMMLHSDIIGKEYIEGKSERKFDFILKNDQQVNHSEEGLAIAA